MISAGNIIRAGYYARTAGYLMENTRSANLDFLNKLDTEKDERKLCQASVIMLHNIQGSLNAQRLDEMTAIPGKRTLQAPLFEALASGKVPKVP